MRTYEDKLIKINYSCLTKQNTEIRNRRNKTETPEKNSNNVGTGSKSVLREDQAPFFSAHFRRVQGAGEKSGLKTSIESYQATTCGFCLWFLFCFTKA